MRAFGPRSAIAAAVARARTSESAPRSDERRTRDGVVRRPECSLSRSSDFRRDAAQRRGDRRVVMKTPAVARATQHRPRQRHPLLARVRTEPWRDRQQVVGGLVFARPVERLADVARDAWRCRPGRSPGRRRSAPGARSAIRAGLRSPCRSGRPSRSRTSAPSSHRGVRAESPCRRRSSAARSRSDRQGDRTRRGRRRRDRRHASRRASRARACRSRDPGATARARRRGRGRRRRPCRPTPSTPCGADRARRGIGRGEAEVGRRSSTLSLHLDGAVDGRRHDRLAGFDRQRFAHARGSGHARPRDRRHPGARSSPP